VFTDFLDKVGWQYHQTFTICVVAFSLSYYFVRKLDDGSRIKMHYYFLQQNQHVPKEKEGEQLEF